MMLDMNFIKKELIKVFERKNYIIEEATEKSLKFKYCGVSFNILYLECGTCKLIQFKNNKIVFEKSYDNILRLLNDIYTIEEVVDSEMKTVLKKANIMCDILEQEETILKSKYNVLKGSVSLELFNKIKKIQNLYQDIYSVVYNLENNYISVGRALELLNKLNFENVLNC